MGKTRANNPQGFKKGYDPRRAVHMGKGVQVFRETLADHMRKLSLDAVAYVQSVLNDEKAPQKLRVVCAQEIMNRSWGLPVNSINIQALDSADEVDVKNLSTAELERLAIKFAIKEGVVMDNDILEGEVSEIVSNTNSPDAETATKNSLKQSGIS